MAYAVYIANQLKYQFTTREQCVAEILVKGLVQDIHRYGIVFKKGVEIRATDGSPELVLIDEKERT